MKILSTEEVRSTDAWTIKNEPITSINLMERAARACADWLLNARLPFGLKKNAAARMLVVCGLGNNGGDGLAIARMLSGRRFKVDVIIVRYDGKPSKDFLTNEKRLKKIKKVKLIQLKTLQEAKKLDLQGKYDMIIDALFGSGISRPLDGLPLATVMAMNSSGIPVVAIDAPSGLTEHGAEGTCVKAWHTLSFQCPKLSFLFPENYDRVGGFSVLDIGLDQEFISKLSSKNYFLTRSDVNGLLRKRKKFEHKGSFGHALIVAGSFGKMGAAVLAARACLRSGSGLVTAHIPACGYPIMQTAVPEVMVETDRDTKNISGPIKIESYNAVGFGPGIGQDPGTQSAIKVLIQNSSRPLVIDADGLNILSENRTWLSFLPKGSILTPHPGEFKRLIGDPEPSAESLEMQKEFSFKYGVYVLLKGAHSRLTCPDGEVYFNSTGNPGMATAGSGDVLTGVITGLLAQGYDSKKAATLGMYIHGLAGDLAVENRSQEALTASDLIERMGAAFTWIR